MVGIKRGSEVLVTSGKFKDKTGVALHISTSHHLSDKIRWAVRVLGPLGMQTILIHECNLINKSVFVKAPR